jgi:hypothetical protein
MITNQRIILIDGISKPACPEMSVRIYTMPLRRLVPVGSACHWRIAEKGGSCHSASCRQRSAPTMTMMVAVARNVYVAEGASDS